MLKAELENGGITGPPILEADVAKGGGGGKIGGPPILEADVAKGGGGGNVMIGGGGGGPPKHITGCGIQLLPRNPLMNRHVPSPLHST